MNIILDSNVIIAAFSSRGLCQSVFELCLDRYKIYINDHILNEVNTVLNKKFKMKKNKVKLIIDFLKNYSVVSKEKEISINICRDRDDNKILALCKNNEIKYIITGDNDLLVLRNYESTKIIKPRYFWEIVKKQNI